jgi:hypothetical protein
MGYTATKRQLGEIKFVDHHRKMAGFGKQKVTNPESDQLVKTLA